MPYRLLIAVAAGLVSAVVFASATTGPLLMRMVLFLVTPLALFLAGLGLGPLAAAVAGIAGTLLVLVAGTPVGALVFAAAQAIPVALLIYLAQLNRSASDGSVEWYPAGRLIIVAAILAGVFSSLTLMLLGGDVEALRTALRAMLQTFVTNELPKMPDAPTLGPAEIDEATAIALALLPAASAISTMGSLLFNFWLAGRITLASGRLKRPWPDIPAIVYPPVTPLLLAVATGAAFLAGLPGLIAAGFAGPLFLAYVLLGLAVVHYMTRGLSWRPFALWGLYASLFIMNTIASLAIALLGLAEAIWPMRKISPPPKPPPPT
ncbi:MAG: DUF2232 domain-containing protein [Hyphomicrobium sp.]|nr:DUF2232 domain-containing protein [Hyphomicrobium sp.]